MKKIEKKKEKKTFFDFISTCKGPESGKEKNRKSGVRTFENFPDFRTGRDVRLSPRIETVHNRTLICLCNVVVVVYYHKAFDKAGPSYQHHTQSYISQVN